jgi:hypothetical protein
MTARTLVPTLVPTLPERAILDSGCTSHLIKSTTPCLNKIPTTNGLRVRTANGETMEASHDATLNLNHFPLSLHNRARQASVQPELKNPSCLSASCATTAVTTSS